MNRILLVPSFLILMFFIGFDSEHLNLADHAKIIAPIIRVDESEVKLLSYCDYRAMKEFTEKKILASQGIVAMNDSHFYIMSRYQDRVKTQGIVRIPIREIESLSTSPAHFHIKHQGLIMFVWLNEARSRELTEENHNTVSQLFAQNDVPTSEGNETYEIAKLPNKGNKRFNSGFYNSGFNFSDGFESSYYGAYPPIEPDHNH